MPCCGAWRARARSAWPRSIRSLSIRPAGCWRAGQRPTAKPTAHAIAAANGREPALDLTVKSDPEAWAAQLNGRVLPTGTVRTIAHGPVTALPGFAEGAWWVQDAAAALPARLFGDLAGQARRRSVRRARRQDRAACGRRRARHRRRPGAGAARSRARKSRSGCRSLPSLSAPTRRRGRPSKNSTPCCSMRRARRPAPSAVIPTCRGSSAPRDIAALPRAEPIDRARAGADQKRRHADLLHLFARARGERGRRRRASSPRNDGVRRAPIAASEVFGTAEFISKDGDLRTLPCQLPDTDSRLSGLDGFYAARLQKL